LACKKKKRKMSNSLKIETFITLKAEETGEEEEAGLRTYREVERPVVVEQGLGEGGLMDKRRWWLGKGM
jgi:hypothetical protein